MLHLQLEKYSFQQKQWNYWIFCKQYCFTPKRCM